MSAQRKPKSKAPGGVAALVLASAGLMAFLGVWESGSKRVLVVYADKLASGLPTVCNGLTRHVTTTPIIVGARWTDARCEAEEKAAMIAHVQRPLLKCFRVKPPQSVFDAASSHGWNFGVQKTCRSMAMAAWAREDWELGCKRIYQSDSGKPVWSYAGGKFYPGLQNRRKAEYKMCIADL